MVWLVVSLAVTTALARAWRAGGPRIHVLAPAAVVVLAFAAAAFAGFRHIPDAFVPVKLVSVWAALIFMSVVRLRGDGGARWAKQAIVILLGVNILEAVVAETVDLSMGGPTRDLGGHPANIIAGLLVLVTVRGADHMEVTPDEGRTLSYDLGWNGSWPTRYGTSRSSAALAHPT